MVQWSVSSAAQGTATSMEPTKPSTSSSGDSMDSSNSFTDCKNRGTKLAQENPRRPLSPLPVCSTLESSPAAPDPHMLPTRPTSAHADPSCGPITASPHVPNILSQRRGKLKDEEEKARRRG